jgi:hypothetical protein
LNHAPMDLQQICPQCADIPYIRVARDERGSVCWLVVAGDQQVPAASGAMAAKICEAMRAKRIAT